MYTINFSQLRRLSDSDVMFRKKFIVLTRRRISFFIIPSLVISTIFIIYQITIFLQISNEHKLKTVPNLIRGSHVEQAKFYTPSEDDEFKCITSLEVMEFSRVNDNYCDCLDGSDEPGTNACTNGRFFCANQAVTKRFRKSVESAKVNDGICDCCDGSDEWANNQVLIIDRDLQKKADRYHVPCPNKC